MKTFWAWSAKILFVALLIGGWYLYQQQDYQQLVNENKKLEADLRLAQEQLASANDKVAELEKKSLDGILRETNKVVVSGWKTLLDTVEQELEKARNMIDQEGNAEPEKPKPEAEEAPPVEEPIRGERT